MTAILYSFRRCPYAMRARLALLASDTACEVREIALRDKPAAMLAASPKGTVPVLVLADRVIEESLDIMRWALGENDPEGWLARDDRDLIARNDDAFKHHLDRYKYPELHDGDADAHRAGGLAILHDLDARLAGSTQLAGDRRGFADMAIMPSSGNSPPWIATGLQAKPCRICRWLEGHLASSLFDAAMTRHPVWRQGDVPVMLA